MGVKTFIEVSCRFDGTHSWPEAPQQVDFLRNPHRHVFHVLARIEVGHDDRQIEFIMAKRYVSNFVYSWPKDLGRKSCEMMAREILQHLLKEYGPTRDTIVSVSEDGENGAIVEYRA